MTRLTFVAHGKPVPQGSHIRTQHGLRDSNAHLLKPWRQTVAHAALDASLLADLPQFREALVVRAAFYFNRPKAHYRSGKNAHLLRDDAPHFPTGRGYGDTDKLQRSIGDALVDVAVIKDDSQIVHWVARKLFVGDHAAMQHPGVVVEVYPASPP